MANLVKTSSVLEETKKQSSLDLVLARCLNEVSLIYKAEMLPGEIRVWQDCLQDSQPETVRAAFAEYFKTGKFPPRPADISTIVLELQQRPKKELPPFWPCTVCNSGGVKVGDKVTRCQCWLNWRESVR